MHRPLHYETALEESVAPEGPEGAHSANSLLRRIASLLQDHSYEEAVRHFLDAQEMHLFSSNGELLDDLLDLYGRDLTARLVSAFAHFPCPACKDGLEPCSDCEGNGTRYEGLGCASCVGTGRMRCSFCGGSGLATYATVPASLRYLVLNHRVRMLSRRVGPTISQDLPADEIGLHDVLLSLNKLLLAFEDAVIIGDAVIEHDPILRAPVGQLTQACRHAPQRLQPRIRSILRRLAQLPGTNHHRADFYRALADSPAFAGTALHHPLLTE